MDIEPRTQVSETRLSYEQRRLRLISILETLSFLGLLGAMFLESDRGISILGATHGLLFLGYAFLVWADRDDLGWTIGFAVVSIVTGPLGAIIVLERLRREASDTTAARRIRRHR